MPSNYLDALDKILQAGVSRLSDEFTSRQANFVAETQMKDGCFRGRQGGGDLYYTDFGVRIMAALAPECEALTLTAGRINREWPAPKNVLECFSLLNIARILSNCDLPTSTDNAAIALCLETQLLPEGGFARPGSSQVSAYNTFLAALCWEMMDAELPNADGAVRAIRSLKCGDGGCCEAPGQTTGQTSATAAAVASLTILHSLSDEDARGAVDFLSRMQTSDGGLLAQPSAPQPDLLSTFTGALTLFGLGGLDRIDLPAMAQFLGQVISKHGGFRASPSDNEEDVEYTYYGLATFALLQVYVLAKESE